MCVCNTCPARTGGGIDVCCINSLAIVIGKLYANEIDPVANTFVQLLIGAVVLSAIGLVGESAVALNFTTAAIAAILYLATFGTAFVFVAQYWMLTKMSATNLSLFAFISRSSPSCWAGCYWVRL